MKRLLVVMVCFCLVSVGMAHAKTEIEYVKTPEKTFRLAHALAEGCPYDLGAKRFAQLVEVYSRGRLEVKIFPNAQLGNEVDTSKNVQLGMIDFAVVPVNNMSMWYRSVDVATLPFIFRDRYHVEKFITGPVGKELFENYRKASGVRVLSFFEWGDRAIGTKKTLVKKPEDLRGLKIRTPKNPIIIDTYQALGATPTAIDQGELYQALQQGLADGLESPANGIVDMKWYDFLKCYTHVSVIFGVATIITNDKVFSALPAEDQAILLRAGLEAGEYQRWISAKAHVDGIDRLRKEGTEIYIVEDDTPFRESVKSVHQKYESIIGKEWIDKVKNIK